MFNPNLHHARAEGRQETVVSLITFNADSQTLYQPPMEYFGPPSDWSPIEGDTVQFSQSFTLSPTELPGGINSNQEGAASSSDGGMTPSLLGLVKESLTGQDERVSRLCLA